VGKKKGKFDKVDVGVLKEGVKIVLPKNMSLEDGIEALKRKIKEEQTEIAIHEEVEAFPLDGAYALMQVLKSRYGWAHPVPEETFFGPRPPVMVNLEIAYGKQTQVIWGQFTLPGIEGVIKTGVAKKYGQMIFAISGQVKKKYEDQVKQIADEVRAYVRESSIYRGKAIRLRTNDNGDFDMANPPMFLDLSKVREEELIFPDAVHAQVQTSLWTPIEKTEACRAHKIPLKRGVLLEGKYGTGKTLTAYVTAKKCEENAWTFLYLDRVSALKDAILIARQYSPAVIFAEDIDRVVTGDRDADVDDVLNNIDGIDSKNQEIIVILTTNHVENIEKAMLRPGRLDAVISVPAPDAKAAERLMRLYGRDLIPASESLTGAAKVLEGCIPAVVREVVERSKLYAISRSDDVYLTGADLEQAALTMKHHLSLMEAPRDAKTPEQVFGETLKVLVARSMPEHMEEVIDAIKERV
jgi:transitional endoplasmic reticulum ATPase